MAESSLRGRTGRGYMSCCKNNCKIRYSKDTAMLNNIKFPVIFFSQNLMFLIRGKDDFITCSISMALLEKGFYKNMVPETCETGYELIEDEEFCK